MVENIGRIDRITEKVNELWHKNPDLSFLDIVTLFVKSSIKDDEIELNLKKILKE